MLPSRAARANVQCTVFHKEHQVGGKREIDATHIDHRFKDCVLDFNLFCSFQCMISPKQIS